MAEQNYNRFGQEAEGGQSDGDAGDVDRKLELICRNLQEVCKKEIMTKILKEEKRDIKIYWGTATTGRPHVAYFVPMTKIADFLRAGCEVTVLFADIHGYLDNMKSTFELLKHRTEYYKNVISAALHSIGVSTDKLKFRTGSSYQLTPEFTLDILKLTTLCSEHDAKKAGAEVVKQTASAPLSGLLYPIYQWLDEEYLGVDAQFGGVDQRKIFISAEKYLPKIGYKERAHLMNPMVPGLTGEKMSSSDVDSKIDLIDDPAKVKKKIKKVFCEAGNIEKNPLLAFIKSVVLLVRGQFELLRRDKESIIYTEYDKLEADFAAGEAVIHPADLKESVVVALNSLLAPIRERFEQPDMVKLTEMAYPPEVKQKKEKKVKGGAKGGDSGGDKPAAAKSGAGGGQSSEMDISRIDIRVGKITKIGPHPDADSMYVEDIDIGESEPRLVCSGLVGRIPMEELQDRMVVVVCNLKPAKLRGIKSCAMLLCATGADGKTECLDPPANSVIGDRITVEGFPGTPDSVIKPGSSKKVGVWETVQPELGVSDGRVAQYKGVDLKTSKGSLTVATLTGASIK